MTTHVEVAEGTVVVDDRGPRTSDAVVLLHGFTGDRSTWGAVAARLAATRRVVVPDLPGHGETRLDGPLTMERTERALEAMLAQLAVRTVTLVGYSMGGRLALYVALHTPVRVRALVLESASPGLERDADRRARCDADEALARTLEDGGLAAFVDDWTAQPLFATQPAALRARLRAQRLGGSARGFAASLRGMGTGAQPWLGDRLPALRIAVLVVSGALDSKFTSLAAAMQARLPNAEHVVVPDAGHAVHLEQPASFGDALETFLDQQGGVECRPTG